MAETRTYRRAVTIHGGRWTRRFVAACAAIALGPAVARAQIAAPAVDLTGKWSINIGTPDSPEYRTLDAVMTPDGVLRGTLGSPNGAVPIRDGRVVGQRFTLAAMLGTGLPLSYDGIVSHDSIRGTWRYDKREGAFIGRRGDVAPRAEPVAPRRVDAPIDGLVRAATIDSIAREIRAAYVDTALGPRVIDAIRERARAGAYDTLTTVAAFARGVTQDLRRFDKHFAIFPTTSTGQPPIAAAARDNYAIKRIERLDGNVGYFKFDVFSIDSSAAGVLRTALRFLARTDALILDLRDNHGGNGALGQMLLSYLAPGPARVTADAFTRTAAGFDSATVNTTASIEQDIQYGGRPLYVLTSPRTASAAEWLAYNLQAMRRAQIVGEVTAGAAHPIRFVRLTNLFDASIPIGRVRSRITGTDFEGVGVQPDFRVPADHAFGAAYGDALRLLVSRASDPMVKAELERAAANVKPQAGPPEERSTEQTPAGLL